MAKSAQSVAEDIQELLRKNAIDVVTIPWPDFYKLAERERIKDAFMEELRSKLREHALLISYGQAVVLIGKDFKFSPVKF
jgi:uncharacterized FlgJ-related protein